MKTNQMIEVFALDDEELEMVWGGRVIQFMRIACPHCGTINNVNVMFSSYRCGHCQTSNRILG